MSELFAVVDYEKKKWAEQTQRALTLLIIGALVTAIPIIRPAGCFVTVAGIIFLVEGRDPFGHRHSIHIALGTIVFAVAAFLFIMASVGYTLFFYALSTKLGDCCNLIIDPVKSVIPLATIEMLPSFLAMDTIGSILAPLGFAVLTYQLQNLRERVLLAVGLTVGLGTSMVSLSVLQSEYTSQLMPINGLSLNTTSAIDTANLFKGELLRWSSLGLVSAIILAIAFYSAHSRMDLRKGV